MNVSVCMATCNGEAFLQEQLDSILPQLSADDELIIIDDASSDSTRTVIAAYTDVRIRCQYNNERLGHVPSFSLAIAQATQSIIVLADQDDIWATNRLQHIKQALQPCEIQVVAGNFDMIDEHGNLQVPPKKILKNQDSNKHWRNIFNIFLGQRPYYGCAMAFKKEFNEIILPIPAHVESHDLWIAFAGNITKSTKHIENILLHKREHSDNTSTKRRRGLAKIISSRVLMCYSVMLLLIRKRLAKKPV